MSLLTIIQNAADRLGIVRPSSAVGSADLQIRQLVALSNQEGRELARAHPWQAITIETTFTATATETQTGAIPAGFDRFITGTVFNRTSHRKVTGPMTSMEWAEYKGRSQSPIYDAFRVRGSAMLLAPTPTAGDTYAFEYVSKYWCTTAAGTSGTLDAWSADDNVAVLDEELLTDGLIWRFLRAKGLDYSEAFRTYETQKMLLMARDGGSRPTNIANGGGRNHRGPWKPTFPESSWSIT